MYKTKLDTIASCLDKFILRKRYIISENTKFEAILRDLIIFE